MLAVDAWDRSSASVRSYISRTGATYPVLVRGGVVTQAFGIAYDNYVVIDAEGIIRYTSVSETFTGLGRWNDASVRAAIVQNLPTAVESQTWSAVKSLYGTRQPSVTRP